jgi:hypothetical protein
VSLYVAAGFQSLKKRWPIGVNKGTAIAFGVVEPIADQDGNCVEEASVSFGSHGVDDLRE